MLAEFKDNCHADEFKKYHSSVMPLFEEHSEKLLERFQLVADGKNGSVVRGKVFALLLAICLLTVSYSFIIQSKYDVPIDEIEIEDKAYEVNGENAYITIRNGEYILHSEEGAVVIEKEMADMMIEEGFPFIE